jgi:DNA-binding XRE family transcriptional regulator
MARINSPARELEEMEDQRDAAIAMLARMQTANDELLPWALVKRLTSGENPVRVWREHRGMEPDRLAALAQLTPAALGAIEAGKTELSLRIAAALARALNVDADDLLPAEGEDR